MSDTTASMLAFTWPESEKILRKAVDKHLVRIPPDIEIVDYLKPAIQETKRASPEDVRLAAQKLRIGGELLQSAAGQCLLELRALEIRGADGDAADRKECESEAETFRAASEYFLHLANEAEDRARELLERPEVDAMSHHDLVERATAEADAAGALTKDAVDSRDGKKRAARKIEEHQFHVKERNILDGAADIAQSSMANSLAAMAAHPLGTATAPMRVQLKRAEIPDTPDTALWMLIRDASLCMSYDSYEAFIDYVVAGLPGAGGSRRLDKFGGRKRMKEAIDGKARLPFPDVEPYRVLKAATEVFMMVNSGVYPAKAGDGDGSGKPLSFAFQRDPLPYAVRRGFTASEHSPEEKLQALAEPLGTSGRDTPFPYLALIQRKLQDVMLGGPDNDGRELTQTYGLLMEKLTNPYLLELIWSYWHEEGMLVQTVNAITRRFQNVRTPGDHDPLANQEMDPLRPLSNFLWGYVQDEQHRLSVVRRGFEYDKEYGLRIIGKAIPSVRGADSRTQFLEAFHNLLHVCSIFFKEDDDTTVIADGFPVLNALRDVHIILAQGAHNQYGDLPWTARQEMLMQQWLLARPEMREFLPTRIMVAYPEPWQDRVDAMKGLMGWTDTSVLHFHDLGVYGERILLGARFNDWSRVSEPERAANWARYWRPEIQGYVHAYRAATGVDLSDRSDATMPSTLLRNRLLAQRAAAR